MYSLIKKMVCCAGTSGSEKKIAEVIRGEIAPYVDEITYDALGSLVALKKGTAAEGEKKKILLCAHMDEIGFMVTFIEDNGMLRLAPLGGINFTAAAFSEVVFENGTRGVIVPEAGTKPEDLKADKFYVDIGASTAGEASRRVSVGDRFALVQYTTRLSKNRIVGRPIDDRAGCAVLIEIAKRIFGGCRDDVYFAFTVQEEVGCRGARPVGFAVAPDVAIAFDVTGVGDVPGAKPMAVSLGDGAAIKVRDASVICDAGLVDQLHKIAADKKITHQTEVLISGGTDTSSLQMAGAGCAAGAISIPSRYIHSGVEMIDLRDAEACAALGTAYILGE
ncbi:MAG: M20/M25/M40 family metallo-hydrolase [Clostridia bacterium]|nr:M20/M25/M40 family metallo-hydrolase [Clostridia bacterium]